MEGKKKYFVLVLFLLLALMIFAFANPITDDGKEFQDNGNDETEQVEKPEVIVDTEDNNENYVPVVRPVQPVQNNQTAEEQEDEIDTTYEDALAAVEYAEASYKAEDVEKAKELVNKVTDTTKKGELEDRLAEVEAGIEVMELIEELEYQVGKATEREDIVSAKDYRDENEVAKKLDALTNEDVKEALQERLDKVNEYLDDETAPVVNIKDKDIFTEDVEITVEDENDVTITLTKDGKEVEDTSKTAGDGNYTLVVVDKAFNEVTINFVVDGTAPVVDEGDDLTLEAGVDTVPELTAKAIDEVQGEWTITPAYINRHNADNTIDRNLPAVDINVVGKYNVVFQAKDNAGNLSEKKSKMVYVVDTTGPVIELPGQEGKNNNEFIILKDSYITIKDYLRANVTDNVDEDKVIEPLNFRKCYPSGSGKSCEKYTLESNGGFDTSVAGIYYKVTYQATDSHNNTTTKTMLLVVDEPYEPVIKNNTINVEKDLTLNSKPFYNDKTREEELTINGNGHTITQNVNKAYKYTWDVTGTRPMQSNMFTSANNSLVTVNDLNFAGTMYSITLGHYRSSNQSGFTTVLNNVNVINTKVASFSGGLSPAMSIYGKATLNNVNVYGTTLSELDTNPQWPVYDVIMVNNTDTTINGGKIGTIFTWPKAYLEINNAEIGTIDTQIEYRSDYTKAGLVIGENTKVEKIIIRENKAVVTIKSTAEVGVLDLCANEETNMYLNIEPGAKIGKVIVKNGDSCLEMTYEEWQPVVTLAEDTTLDKVLEVKEGREKVLDLNGKTLTVSNEEVSDLIQNNGKLTIKNGKVINKTPGAAIKNNENSELILEKIAFEDATNKNQDVIINNGKLTVTDCTFNIKGSNGNVAIKSSGDLVIKNVKIDNASTVAYSVNIYGGNSTIDNLTINSNRGGIGVLGGNVTVNNSDINVKNKYYAFYIVSNYDTNVTINSGTYKTTRHSAIYISKSTGSLLLTINGGNFSSSQKAAVTLGTGITKDNFVIKGGKFIKYNATAYIAEGYEQKTDGTVVAK